MFYLIVLLVGFLTSSWNHDFSLLKKNNNKIILPLSSEVNFHLFVAAGHFLIFFSQVL